MNGAHHRPVILRSALTKLHSIKPKSTWGLLKPHFDTLVRSYVFPQMSFTSAKQELWESDPVDYVRVTVGGWHISSTECFDTDIMTIDEYEAYDTPLSAATTFLLSLASNRTKTTFMTILGFINNVLQS